MKKITADVIRNDYISRFLYQISHIFYHQISMLRRIRCRRCIRNQITDKAICGLEWQSLIICGYRVKQVTCVVKQNGRRKIVRFFKCGIGCVIDGFFHKLVIFAANRRFKALPLCAFVQRTAKIRCQFLTVRIGSILIFYVKILESSLTSELLVEKKSNLSDSAIIR